MTASLHLMYLQIPRWMKTSVRIKRIPVFITYLHMQQLGITRRSPLPSLPNCHNTNCLYAACLIALFSSASSSCGNA